MLFAIAGFLFLWFIAAILVFIASSYWLKKNEFNPGVFPRIKSISSLASVILGITVVVLYIVGSMHLGFNKNKTDDFIEPYQNKVMYTSHKIELADEEAVKTLLENKDNESESAYKYRAETAEQKLRNTLNELNDGNLDTIEQIFGRTDITLRPIILEEVEKAIKIKDKEYYQIRLYYIDTDKQKEDENELRNQVENSSLFKDYSESDKNGYIRSVMNSNYNRGDYKVEKSFILELGDDTSLIFSDDLKNFIIKGSGEKEEIEEIKEIEESN